MKPMLGIQLSFTSPHPDDRCSCVYADKLIRVCVHFRPNLMLIKVICKW
ncbi:MAG: hypothetical protein V8T62_02935 [Oscillospiraceae bacterium]